MIPRFKFITYYGCLFFCTSRSFLRWKYRLWQCHKCGKCLPQDKKLPLVIITSIMVVNYVFKKGRNSHTNLINYISNATIYDIIDTSWKSRTGNNKIYLFHYQQIYFF